MKIRVSMSVEIEVDAEMPVRKDFYSKYKDDIVTEIDVFKNRIENGIRHHESSNNTIKSYMYVTESEN